MSDTPLSFSSLVGKTIATVDESSVNVKTLTFTDGTIVNVEAEVEAFSGFPVPHIFLYPSSEENEEKNKILRTSLATSNT